MKTGIIHGNANTPVKKHYYYHGGLRDCNIQPKPEPFDELENIPGEYFVLTFGYENVTENSADLEGVLIFPEGLTKCTLRGFMFGETGSYGNEVNEVGNFAAGNYILPITY